MASSSSSSSSSFNGQAAVLTELNTFEFQERSCGPPAAGMVVIRQRATGLCGSDVSYCYKGRCGDFKLSGPIVLGHESAGEVAAVGDGVSHLKVGDRVALEPGVPCRTCEHCRSGRYNLCKDVEFLATPPYDGSLSTYMTHPADFCFKLNDNVSLEQGAFLEPLSVGVHACDRAGVTIGSTILVTGAGPIGLICMLVARAAGATKVVLSDINEARLAKAMELGATATVNAAAPDFGAQVVAALGGEGPHVTMDCSGVSSAIHAGLSVTRPGGKFVSIGRGAQDNVSIPLFLVMDREIDILGVFRYKNTYPKALALLASGAIDVSPLITHRFELSQVKDAFDLAHSGDDGAIKVMLNM